MDKEVEGGKRGGGDNVNIVFMQEIPKHKYKSKWNKILSIWKGKQKEVQREKSELYAIVIEMHSY